MVPAREKRKRYAMALLPPRVRCPASSSPFLWIRCAFAHCLSGYIPLGGSLPRERLPPTLLFARIFPLFRAGRPYLELRAGRPDWFRELG
eukprot:6171833-Pleurochrysis_carterae.AAC.1